jgi:hypothetical protein
MAKEEPGEKREDYVNNQLRTIMQSDRDAGNEDLNKDNRQTN